MTVRVHTHISDSPCVVQLREDWELYIDTRDYSPTSHKIEVVRQGHVRHREYRHPQEVPGRIVNIMRQLKRGIAAEGLLPSPIPNDLSHNRFSTNDKD